MENLKKKRKDNILVSGKSHWIPLPKADIDESQIDVLIIINI